ncbi:DMT family transporter [bacterium]|nr:DMT family transporter [bacterium]
MKQLNNKVFAIFCAILSALLYGICIPFSKMLSSHVSSLILGGLLYLGAGFGLLITNFVKKNDLSLTLDKKDVLNIICMVVLDAFAVSFLMWGLSLTTSANASLISNFELVITSLAAYLFFREKVSFRLFLGIILITIACIILNFEGNESLNFGYGAPMVILASICWGFENNFTKLLSTKDTRQITIIKGCFSGSIAMILGFMAQENLPEFSWIILSMFLGFFSYGLSVSLYIFSQRHLGASKTGAYFALAPYMGVISSLFILKERPELQFYIALLIMISATFLVISDTLKSKN